MYKAVIKELVILQSLPCQLEVPLRAVNHTVV